MNLTVDASVFVAASRSKVETFPRLQLIPLDLPLAHRAVQVAKDHRLRGADAVYVCVAEVFNSKLIAWDAEMLACSTGAVATMTPLEWMEEQAATG